MVKITNLELENVKRIKAVSLTPAENGLTVIGGGNGEGKTSVLDALAWALGGDKFKPSNPQRDGSVIPPHLHIELSNGLIVERKGDKGALKVTDPSSRKGGQQLLNEFVEQLALDLPKFMQASAKDKAETLLKIIGVGDKLTELETKEQQTYNQRRTIGQIADQKQKYADELPNYPGAPAKEVSVSDLIKQQQDILARNGENQRKRDDLARIEREYAEVLEKFEQLKSDLEAARKSAEDLQDESTAEIEADIRNIDEINTKVRANLAREHAEAEAKELRSQYNDLSSELENIRKAKADLLGGANLPLKGLSVADGELTYNGAKWDCMSGAEQLKVAAAIVRKLNPKCGFVLMDKLEQMDEKTLCEFGEWLEAEGLQVIAARVSTGGECSIIIEDGTSYVPETISKQTWTKGVF